MRRSPTPRARSPATPRGSSIRCGSAILIEVRGEAQKDGKLRIWAADKNGVLCGEMDLEFAQ